MTLPVSATVALANSDLCIGNFLLSFQKKKNQRERRKIRSWKAGQLLSSKSHLKEIEMRRYFVTGLLPREADGRSKSPAILRACSWPPNAQACSFRNESAKQRPSPESLEFWQAIVLPWALKSLPEHRGYPCRALRADDLSIKHEICGTGGGKAKQGGRGTLAKRNINS